MVHGLFRDLDNIYGKLEEIVIDIEKYTHDLDWSRASIQSALCNLENPEIDKETKYFLVKDLRDNLNKREEATAKYYYLKYQSLRLEMFKLFIIGTPDSFMEDLEMLKKQKGINNLWVEARNNNWFKNEK